MNKAMVLLLALLMAMPLVTGCTRVLGGAALGAAGTGAAYEYQNKRRMDDLEKERSEGKISQEEYERRKKEIEKGSLVY